MTRGANDDEDLITSLRELLNEDHQDANPVINRAQTQKEKQDAKLKQNINARIKENEDRLLSDKAKFD